MTTGSDYWLARWLDDHELRNERDAQRFLEEPRHIEDLRAAASAARTTAEPLGGAEETTIVAGRTIDLSGKLGCYHPECLQRDVDRLFSRVWHYFDIIVVEGLAPTSMLSMLADQQGDFRERFLGFVKNFFYVRKIGAENMLVYREKPPACTLHLRQHAEQFAATNLLEERKSWVSSFSSDARIQSLDKHDDHWHYVVTHPNIEHMALGLVRNGSRSRKPTKSQIFGAVFDEYAANLVSDIGAARTMLSPLGAAASIHEGLLSRAPVDDAPNVQDALFELDLPTISGLSAKDLIKIRQENWQYFDAFRLALKTAARDFIANAGDGVPSEDIARQIKDDVIEPELIKIRRELRISADSLTRKSAVSLPVGALATTIGLLDKFPLVAIGGAAIVTAAGIGSFLLDYKKYIDDKRGVLMSDMYFLWNAQRIASRAKH